MRVKYQAKESDKYVESGYPQKNKAYQKIVDTNQKEIKNLYRKFGGAIFGIILRLNGDKIFSEHIPELTFLEFQS